MIGRRIATEEDLKKFQKSKTYEDVIGFIKSLNEAAIGKDVGTAEPVSATISTLIDIQKKIRETISKHPAKPSKSRFGKPEFTDFYDEVKSEMPSWLSPVTNHPEVSEFLVESCGNRSRIDYGSGHELYFVCGLLCLVKLGMINPEDYQNVVLGVFPEYLRTMRLIQKTYYLEPAGSHGVWGLDDYHFLPYLFGSGQLVNEKFIRPISIHDEDVVAMYEDKNLYFWCISFINRVKTASLRWHSPMLDDISGVKKWSKVNEGMLKMYEAEVLGKLPIVQHFLFGELLPAPEGVTDPKDINDEVHVHCWADCCGIRIPSAIAASEKTSNERRQVSSEGHHFKRNAALPVD